MPEGPEVKIIATNLNTEITGLRLTAIEYDIGSRYAKRGIANHQRLNNYLPLQVLGVSSRGKKIIIELEQGVYLISSLMMEGRWSWHESKHTNLWLCLNEERILYFCDSRHFGSLQIVVDDIDSALSHVGPDLLSDEITLNAWMNKISSKRIAKKKVGIFLMEQKYFSGIGNYLRAEILYAARISPHRGLVSLSNEEKELLFQVTTRIIRESYRDGGLTIHSFDDFYGNKGRYQVKVYGKQTDPNGETIITEKIAERTIHWVPAIQV